MLAAPGKHFSIFHTHMKMPHNITLQRKSAGGRREDALNSGVHCCRVSSPSEGNCRRGRNKWKRLDPCGKGVFGCRKSSPLHTHLRCLPTLTWHSWSNATRSGKAPPLLLKRCWKTHPQYLCHASTQAERITRYPITTYFLTLSWVLYVSSGPTARILHGPPSAYDGSDLFISSVVAHRLRMKGLYEVRRRLRYACLGMAEGDYAAQQCHARIMSHRVM